MYVLVDKKTGWFVHGDKSLHSFQGLCKFIKHAWILPSYSVAVRKLDMWENCEVEQVPAQYANSLQCAPTFEFMEELA